MSNEEHGTVTTSDEPSTATCPVMNAAHQAVGITANQHWWPDSSNLRILRQNHPQADPMGEDFDYAAEFNSLDFDGLANDVDASMTQSQDWWPAIRPLRRFFIRMSWHAAGTYRIADGRGGGGPAPSASPHSTAGPTTPASTRRAGCSGRSSRSTAGRSWADLLVFAGTASSRRWASRRSASAAAAPTCRAPEEDVYWGPSGCGSKTSATAVTGSWRTRWVRFRWG